MSDEEEILDAPEEIKEDAAAELDRIHQAENYRPTMAVNDIPYDPSYGLGERNAPVLTSELSRGETEPGPSELYTLEDLYSSYPGIGTSHYLRVVRKQPAIHGGRRCAGWVTDVYETIDLAKFASRFGGNIYEVSVRGPSKHSKVVNADGTIQTKTLAKIKVEVPGPPITQVGDEDMSNQKSQSMFLGGITEDPRVQLKKLELDAEERRRRETREERSRQELLGRSQISPDVLEAVERAADKRGEEVRRASAEVITSLREQNKRLAEQSEIRERTVQELREKLLNERTEMSARLREEESRQVRELRERHSDEAKRMKEEHASNIQRMQGDHQRTINDLTERAQRERDHTAKMDQMERDRMRDEAARREKQLIDDHTRREREMREAYDNRLKDIEGSQQRELRAIKDMRDREIETIRSSESSKATLTEKTAEVQLNILQGESQRAQAELESLRRENEDLRSKLNKPPMEAVREAHEIAALTGFGNQKEDFDWKQTAASAVKGLIDKAPEIAKELGSVREENKAAAAAARAQQQARIARARLPQAPPQQRTAPPQQPKNDYQPEPPPGWGQWQPQQMPPEEKKPAPPTIGGDDPTKKEPGEIPIGGEQQASPAISPMHMETATAEQPKEKVSEPQAQPGIDEQAVQQFIDQLDTAISSGIISPKTFAENLVKEIGPETCRQILSSFSPDDLVTAIEQQPGAKSAAIATRAGRKYVEQLWQEALSLVADKQDSA